MFNIKIKFEASGPRSVVEDICQNFTENYPEFSSRMEEEDFRYVDETKSFLLLWSGEFHEGDLNDSDISNLIRLTHHAEGLYTDTEAEFVHVEVYINDKWYGR